MILRLPQCARLQIPDVRFFHRAGQITSPECERPETVTRLTACQGSLQAHASAKDPDYRPTERTGVAWLSCRSVMQPVRDRGRAMRGECQRLVGPWRSIHSPCCLLTIG